MEEHERDPIQEIALFSFHHKKEQFMDGSSVNAMKYYGEIMELERGEIASRETMPDVEECCDA